MKMKNVWKVLCCSGWLGRWEDRAVPVRPTSLHGEEAKDKSFSSEKRKVPESQRLAFLCNFPTFLLYFFLCFASPWPHKQPPQPRIQIRNVSGRKCWLEEKQAWVEQAGEWKATKKWKRMGGWFGVGLAEEWKVLRNEFISIKNDNKFQKLK